MKMKHSLQHYSKWQKETGKTLTALPLPPGSSPMITYLDQCSPLYPGPLALTLFPLSLYAPQQSRQGAHEHPNLSCLSSVHSSPGLLLPWGKSPSPPRSPQGPARPVLVSSPRSPLPSLPLTHSSPVTMAFSLFLNMPGTVLSQGLST